MEHPTPPIPLYRIQEAIKGDVISCHEFHGSNNCFTDFLPLRLVRTTSSMAMTYLPIHLIPFLLFKRKKVLKNPAEQIKKFLKGYVKSLLFASGYNALLSFFLCKGKNITNDMDATFVGPAAAFLAGVALLFENEARRQEIALFLVPKVMESVYALLNRRGAIGKVRHAEEVLFGIATAILLYFFVNAPEHIKAGYYSLMKKLIGSQV